VDPETLGQGPVAGVLHRGQLPHQPPLRYLRWFGQLLEHSPCCERDLRLPGGPLLAEDVGAKVVDETDVYIKHRGNRPGGVVGTVHTLPFQPLDVVGWDGCLYPYVFNVADYEPICGRVHQPRPLTRCSRDPDS